MKRKVINIYEDREIKSYKTVFNNIKNRYATHLLHAHLVFVTKYRYNILTKEHKDKVEILSTVTPEIDNDDLRDLSDINEDIMYILIDILPIDKSRGF